MKSASAAPEEERRGRDPEDMEREAARIREQEAELEAALESAERALEDTSAHRAELERELAAEERRLRDAARAIADRREGLARLNGQVNAARSRAGSAQAEIDRLAEARDGAQERAAAAQQEYEQLKAEVDGLDAGDLELAERHSAAKSALAEAESALTGSRESATAAERERAALAARHEALALGLRRKDGTGVLLGADDRPAGLLGPVAELLTVAAGYEVPVAAALGVAADALAVRDTATAADAIRRLRKQDAGRATLLPGVAAVPSRESGSGGLPGQATGPAGSTAAWGPATAYRSPAAARRCPRTGASGAGGRDARWHVPYGRSGAGGHRSAGGPGRRRCARQRRPCGERPRGGRMGPGPAARPSHSPRPSPSIWSAAPPSCCPGCADCCATSSS